MKKHVWEQIKSVTCEELMKALVKDGFVHQTTSGAVQAFRRACDKRYITIHYHPKKTYGEKMLIALLEDIGWKEEDLKRLKLIK